jgi:hypothetical protein
MDISSQEVDHLLAEEEDRCFARWLLHGEILHRREKGPDPRSTTPCVLRAMSEVFSGEAGLAAFTKQLCIVGERRPRGGEDAELVVRGAALFRELEKFVQWRTAGLLSEEEFRRAKVKLLG